MSTLVAFVESVSVYKLFTKGLLNGHNQVGRDFRQFTPCASAITVAVVWFPWLQKSAWLLRSLGHVFIDWSLWCSLVQLAHFPAGSCNIELRAAQCANPNANSTIFEIDVTSSRLVLSNQNVQKGTTLAGCLLIY